MLQLLRVATVLVACFLPLLAVANDRISVGSLSVERNARIMGELAVPDTGDGVTTSIPVTVVNGAHDGPVLTLIAGIHGSEFSPILAVQRLAQYLDPAAMSGAVIIVHNANLPAFQRRTVYFGPNDLKNLNRLFPGSPDGTVTERIAHNLTEHVIRQSDYLIDIHSGDANERLRPAYTAYYAEGGTEEQQAKSRRMAEAFGLDTIVLFAGDLSEGTSQIYTGAQALTLGAAAIDVESGELGVVSNDFIDPIYDGCLSVMRDLGMIPGESTPTESPMWISERTRVYSDHDGAWHLAPRVRAGQYIQKGSVLGTITDYHGNLVETVRAPVSGLLLIVFGTPPVNKGENIAVIATVPEPG
ncbi:MAG: M14 family metallopeptidase [Pseudomonadota bacterium]